MAHVLSGDDFQAINSSTGVVDFTLGDIGSGSGRAIQIAVLRRDDRFPALSSVVLDPGTGDEAFTVAGSEVSTPGTSPQQAVAYATLINPTSSGTGLTLRVTFSTTMAGGGDCFLLYTVIDGVDTGQSAPTPTTASGETATSSVTEASASGNQIVTQHFQASDATGLDGSAVTGFTNRSDIYGGGYGGVTGDAAGGTSVQMDVEWRDSGVAITGDLAWAAASFDFTAPSAGVSVEAGTATLTLTGQTPTITVTADVAVTPGTATLALTGQTPTIAYGEDVNLYPGTAALSLTGWAPTIEVISDPGDTTLIEAGTATLSLTGQTPSVAYTEHVFVEPGTATLTLTGQTPTIEVRADVMLTPGTATLSLTGQTPIVGIDASLEPGTAALTLTGYAPTITTDASVSLTPGTATLTLVGQTPIVGQSVSVTPGTAGLTLTGGTPTVTVGGNVSVIAGTAALTLTGGTPIITAGAIYPASRDTLPRSGVVNILGRTI